MAQAFEHSSDTGSPLRAQRMTADESRAVIDLWQSERVEQTGFTDKPAIPDVAEGLDISVEDVQRLLREVRARREAEERAFVAEQALAAAEAHLAEEQARLAKLRRQRAELRREQAEEPRPQSSAWKMKTWQEEARPQPLRTSLLEQHSFRKQSERDEPSSLSSYVYAAIILVSAVFVILSNVLK